MLRSSFRSGALALAALIVTFVVLHFAAERSTRWVKHSREVLRGARMVLAGTLEIESAARGHLITRDSVSRERAERALAKTRASLQVVRTLIRGDTIRAAHAAAAANAIRRWQDGFLAPVLRAEDAPADLDEQSLLFADVQNGIESFIDREDALYDRHVRTDNLIRRGGLALLLLQGVGIAVILAGLARRLSEQTHQMVGQQAALEDQASELEEQAVQLEEKTAELEENNEEARALAEDLQLVNDQLMIAIRDSDAAVRARAEAIGFLDAALASAPMGFAFLDNELRFVRVNDAFAEILGRTASESTGQRPSALLGKLGARMESCAAEVIASDAPIRDVETTLEGDGAGARERIWRSTYYPLVIDGSTSGIGVVLREITAQRQLEEQLRQAQKMEAVGQLAGGIAHDFNNILTAITSFTELLLESLPADNAQQGDVREIRRAADRASALTRQLLAFSRRQLLQPEVLDLNHAISGVSQLVGRLLGEDVEFVLDLGEGMPPAKADPGQLEQIVMNLCVNARDAMPNGGRLTIQTFSTAVDEEYSRSIGEDLPVGDYVVLAVSDTGEGMTRQTQARIFEPFFTTKAPGKGTGLGLPTVYGIVKQSGGHVSVYSEPGRGSTFRVYLPAIPGVSVAPGRSTPASMVPATGTETILLVEDDPTVRLVSMRILTRLGYRTLEAAAPDDALAMMQLHADDIDLVITDLVLPQMNGRELAERLREISPAVRLLFISGYTDDAVIRRGLLQPGMAFLPKPFTVQGMSLAVRGALEASAPGPAAPAQS